MKSLLEGVGEGFLIIGIYLISNHLKKNSEVYLLGKDERQPIASFFEGTFVVGCTLAKYATLLKVNLSVGNVSNKEEGGIILYYYF